MKKHKKILLSVLLLLCLLLCGSISVSLAADAGTADDPLITLSYLNETFLDKILSQVDDRIAARNSQLAAELGTGDLGSSNDSSSDDSGSAFTLVTLQQGQSLQGTIGCEVLLRIGSATCTASSSPGLIDETDGTILDNGAFLVQNHLYMMTIEDRSVKATTATVKLLVRGGYTVQQA